MKAEINKTDQDGLKNGAARGLLDTLVMPLLLDLFCCAGGAGEGYKLAGYEVTGVDIEPQPKNPHNFIQSCAFDYLKEHGHKYDVIHASPPCQQYSKASKQWRKAGKKYPDYIAQIRKALIAIGKPWIIENVPGSPLMNPVFLNGSFFGINIHRPRFFETSFTLKQPAIPDMHPVKMGRPIHEGDVLQPVGHFSGVWYAKREMGLPWMGQKELAQAIPPVYTKWIGERVCA